MNFLENDLRIKFVIHFLISTRFAFYHYEEKNEKSHSFIVSYSWWWYRKSYFIIMIELTEFFNNKYVALLCKTFPNVHYPYEELKYIGI